MMQRRQPLLAYSLRELEAGWRWSVIDEGANVIAQGLTADKMTAKRALERAYREAPQLRGDLKADEDA